MPWENKKGKFTKPSIKVMTYWWFMFFALSAIVIFAIGSIIFT
tara:strand:+ start:164 stop:292 length:129 start_codon:yes stop_codon:yes gene_type:complete